MSPTHSEMCHSQVNIIHKKDYKKILFELIKLENLFQNNSPSN